MRLSIAECRDVPFGIRSLSHWMFTPPHQGGETEDLDVSKHPTRGVSLSFVTDRRLLGPLAV